MHPLQNGTQTAERPTPKNPLGDPGFFTESGKNGQPSIPGADYYNAQILEFQNALTELNVELDPKSFNHLATALQKITTNHKAEEHPHEQYSKIDDLQKLPIYPEIITSNNQIRALVADKTLTVESEQIIRLYGWKDFNTTDFQTKSFEIDLAKIYHLRFTEANGLELKDLSDVVYNPTSKAETDISFDSTYSNVLLAKIDAGIVTPLINKAELYAGQEMVGDNYNPVHPERIFTYNWARTPVKAEGLLIGINAHSLTAFNDWNNSAREGVTGFDVLMVSLDRYTVHHKYRAMDDNSSWTGGILGVRFKQEVAA